MSVEQHELLRVLHDRHGPALYRYVARLTGDHTFAQDVVQESLMRAWRHPLILQQSDGAARAWLFTVVRNLPADEVEIFEAIPTTTVARAIIDSRGLVMPERLKEALATARLQGLVTRKEAVEVRKALRESAPK